MKGLRKYLTPFAPDQSGAVSICYALGGMVVIVDAGGCAGNVCGFDEPRWQAGYHAADGIDHHMVEAVFSAGLRDMDAILGRDDVLVRKLADASEKIHADFIALIGTPVPAVIGTDLKSVAAMAVRKTGIPCISVSTDGMHQYDKGIEETLLVLMKEFAKKDENLKKTGRVCGVIGLNPLDLFDPEWIQRIKAAVLARGYDEVLLYGMEGGLDALRKSAEADFNYVVSPAGIAAAGYLRESFGIPFEASFPADPMLMLEEDPTARALELSPDSAILIVHQQILANSIRSRLKDMGVRATVTAATWFDKRDDLSCPQDLRLREEDDFISLIRDNDFDMIIADPMLRPMAGDWHGIWIDAFHFAVSGQAAIDRRMTGPDAGRKQ